MGDEIDEIKNLTVRCGRLIIDYPLTSANLVQPEMNSIPHVLKRPLPPVSDYQRVPNT
jgi:hypothetical protein